MEAMCNLLTNLTLLRMLVAKINKIAIFIDAYSSIPNTLNCIGLCHINKHRALTSSPMMNVRNFTYGLDVYLSGG